MRKEKKWLRHSEIAPSIFLLAAKNISAPIRQTTNFTAYKLTPTKLPLIKFHL